MNKLLTSFLVSFLVYCPTVLSEKVSTNGGLKVSSDDGQYNVKINGRIQLDATTFSSDDVDLNNGSEVRRARLAVSGKITNWSYKLQYDFASGGNIKDAYLAYDGFKNSKIIIGSQNETFGMEAATSSKYITFIERSITSSVFSLGRGMGVSVNRWNKHWTLNAGIFGQDVNSSNKNDEELGASIRVNYAAINETDKLVSFGGSYAYRQPESNTSLRFSARPEAHQANLRIVDTKIDTENFQLFSLESAMKFGSLTILGEYNIADINASAFTRNAKLDSLSVSASYFLTGEVRPYSTKGGKFSNVTPLANGAWELAARFSTTDLNDDYLQGGSADLMTLGVNYYFNSNIRAMMNFINATGDVYDANALIARIQVIW